MIPEGDELNLKMREGISVEIAPSSTYRLHLASNRVYETIDKKEALKQAIFKELSTKKNNHLIYPNYGIDISDLFGQSKELAYVELTRQIEECLLKDDRVLSVTEFFFSNEDTRGNELKISFTVNSIFGHLDISNTWNFDYDWGDINE